MVPVGLPDINMGQRLEGILVSACGRPEHTCYRTREMHQLTLGTVEDLCLFRCLGFRLLGGAELAPPPENYFIDTAEGVRCLGLQPVSRTGPGFGVIGNLMQQGFLFVFDLDRATSRLGFSRTGCID